MSPVRAAWVAGAGIIVLTGVFVSSWTLAWPGELLQGTAFLGIPPALAGSVIAYKLASAPRGRDLAEKLLGLGSSGGDEWDRAMRAELASIDDPRERRRFAAGCLLTTLRLAPRGNWPLVITTGIVLGLGTLLTSRVLLGEDRSGIMVFTIYPPVLILFAVSLVTARRSRSFRTGLVVGALASLAALVGVFAVAIVEAAHWHDLAGVYIMDGDTPNLELDRTGAILDAVSPSFLLFHLLIWTPWPVLGAAFGAIGRGTLEEARTAATIGL